LRAVDTRHKEAIGNRQQAIGLFHFAEGLFHFPKESLNFPKERLNFPKESLNFPKERLNFPKERLNFAKGGLDFPKERLNFPKERLNFPEDFLHFSRFTAEAQRRRVMTHHFFLFFASLRPCQPAGRFAVKKKLLKSHFKEPSPGTVSKKPCYVFPLTMTNQPSGNIRKHYCFL